MIGILPAAGSATRIHGLPKYLLPVGDSYLLKRHVDLMRDESNAVYIGASPENWELAYHYAPDAFLYPPIEYQTMTQTVLSYKEQLVSLGERLEPVIFGMPDTFIEDDQVYAKLYRRLQACDVAVAVFRARPGQHTHGGMVSFSHNRVTEVIDKPAETNLQYIWGALAWKPAFWDCLTPDMPHVGYGLPVAIARGLDVRAVICEGGFWDCGTPEEYFECIRSLTGEATHAT